MPLRLRKSRSILPGFGLAMGYTTLYVSLLIILPLAALFWKTATLSWSQISDNLHDPDFLGSLKLTFGLAFAAALVNAFFGFIAAWTLVRYNFPGRRLVDGLIDLPFALPTAVSGITLAMLYSYNENVKGWLGSLWAGVFTVLHPLWNPFTHLGLPDLPREISYTRLGMFLALIFIGVPFVVRTLQPALEDMDREVEEAATSLGASPSQTFRRILFPALLPALLTGFSLAFARAVGEYGSVIFISSNLPGISEITAHMIVKKLEAHDYAAATLLGAVMLIISFVALAAINGLQWWSSRRTRGGLS